MAAGYRCRRQDRELSVPDMENQIEFLFLRPRDIAVYVGNGTIEFGITGRDLALDSQADVTELMALHFGRSSFRYAVPKNSGLTPESFGNLRIATSYPNIVADDLRKRGVTARVIRLDGAVEISVNLGVADAIADVVESGRTLEQAGLHVVGEPILVSEAILISNSGATTRNHHADLIMKRIRGILVARTYAMIEYDIPDRLLEDACQITPGIESPTVSPLNRKEWSAVKSMISRSEINRILDELGEIGAKGILVTDIRTCRI
jgi:ATP phosphoribosyltransferase